MSSKVISKPVNAVFAINDLSKFSQHTLVAALQCAGNRRHEMRDRVAEVQGIDWGDGAVMNAKWGGVLLRDVLLECGLQDPTKSESEANDSLHVQFSSKQPTTDDEYYGASVPVSVAMDPERECLLATSMNGSPLTARHGHPLRVIVPGIIGARSVKWLSGISISNTESSNHYQQRDYKVLTGDVAARIEQAGDDAEEKGRIMEGVEPMMDNPVNCVVAVPENDGETVHRDRDGRVYVRGYAIPGGKDGPVEKVAVSLDKGGSWFDATILDDGDENNTHAVNKAGEGGITRGKFAWVLWECHIPVDGKAALEVVSIWSRATDRGGNTMDVKKPEGEWNLRGVGYNAVEGRRRIKIV